MKKLLPPVFLLLCVLMMIFSAIGLPLMRLVHWPFNLAGMVLLSAGLWIAHSGSQLFKIQNTNIHTFRNPDKIVTSGLFEHSRNPMYLGFAFVAFGVALLTGAASAFVIAIFHFIVLDRYYIPFEEERMSTNFGQEYEEYKARVRRWM